MPGLGEIPLDEVVHFDVVTHNVSTGAISDADSTPTFSVFEEDTDTPIVSASNFTKRTSLTGNYRGTFTASAANGFELGKWYNIVASATVNSVAAKSIVHTFRILPAETSAGVQKVDISHFGGTAGTFASGRPEVNTTHAAGTAWGSGAITAGSIATNAITSAKIATDAIGSAQIADGAIDAGAIATGAITSTKFAAGAITASVIATDAIDADALATDAVTGLQSGLATSSALSTVSTNVSTAVTQTTAANIRAAVGMASANLDTQIGTLATASSLSTVSTNVSTAVTQTTAASIRTAVGLSSANLDTQIGGLSTGQATTIGYIDTEVAAIKAKTDLIPASPASTGDVTGVWTTAMTESYATDGATMTPAQALYMLLSAVTEFSIAGTTITCKKLDGSTTAMTYTLNDGTNPTSRTRAS